MDGLPTDRPAFSFWRHCAAEDHFGARKVEAHRRFYEQTGVDFIKMMIDGYRDPTGGFAIGCPEDWLRLPLPGPESGFFTQQTALISKMADAIHGEAPVFYHAFSPFSLMRMIWGHELVFAHLKDPGARPMLLQGLERLGGWQAEAVARYLRGTGAAGIMLTLSGAERGLLTEEEHAQYVRPSDLAALDAANGESRYNILHLCGWGPRPNVLERWRDYPAATVDVDIEADGIDLAAWRTLFPAARSLMGGLGTDPGSPLYTGTRRTLERQIRACMAAAGPDGYLVGAGNSFPPE